MCMNITYLAEAKSKGCYGGDDDLLLMMMKMRIIFMDDEGTVASHMFLCYSQYLKVKIHQGSSSEKSLTKQNRCL